MALPSEQRTCCMMVRPFQPRDSKPSSDLFGVGSAQMGQAVDCGHLTGRQWALAGAAPPRAWPGVPVSSGPRPAWVSLRPALVRFAGSERGWSSLKRQGQDGGSSRRRKLSEPVQAQTPESLRPLGFSGEGSEDAQHNDHPASTLRRGCSQRAQRRQGWSRPGAPVMSLC